MHTRTSMHLALFVATLILLSPSVVVAATGNTLVGAAFSNPDIGQEMDDAWKSKAVERGDADLVINLNQQFMQFAPIIEEYAATNNLKIVIGKGTCGISAGAINKKTADIVGFCCPPGKIDRLPGIRFHTIGIHPLSILTHVDNPVTDLTIDQVRDIFQGNIIRWSEVGGPDLPILPVARLHCKNRPGHWRLLLDQEDLFSPEARTVGAIEDMFSLVGANKNAIGFEVMWLLSRTAKVKDIKINGMEPENLDHLIRGEYPLYRSLYLTTWEGDSAASRQAEALIVYLNTAIEKNWRNIGMVPAALLRENGWQFKDDELIGEPAQH